VSFTHPVIHFSQVESTKLSSDSAVRALEAELAVARKAQAGWEAAAKADKAAWGAELESARFEVSDVWLSCP
jgi:hypothetical protein